MNFLKRLTLSLALTLPLLSASLEGADYAPKLGIQTWTLRNMEFDQVVKFCVDHKIKNLQLIGKHFDPNLPAEEVKRRKKILDDNGLHFYTFGVAQTTLNKEENRKLFEFAKQMGIKLIVVEPDDFKILDNLEELAREYDIRVAIHNHGIKSLYGNPHVVRALLKHRDPRMGVCLDVGHVTGAGFDAAQVFRDYQGRVFDIHLKDKVIKKTEGDDVILDVKVGAGQANYKGLFQELEKARWDGVLAIETDNGAFAAHPSEFVQAAIAFVAQFQR